MEKRLPKYKLLLAAVIIAIVSFVDFQLFGRHTHRPDIPAVAIGVIQLATLVFILWLGRWVWRGMPVIRSAWTYSYIAVIAVCTAIGALATFFSVGGVLVTVVGFIRPFFASPMPLLISYLIAKVQDSNRFNMQ
jgi:hypothetical protein